VNDTREGKGKHLQGLCTNKFLTGLLVCIFYIFFWKIWLFIYLESRYSPTSGDAKTSPPSL